MDLEKTPISLDDRLFTIWLFLKSIFKIERLFFWTKFNL